MIYGPNERTDQNSSKRAKQQGDSQPIRCRVQNMVIRMLTEMVKYGHKIEEVKAMQSEIKENVQGTNSDGKETGTQISGLDQKEK